MRPYLAEYQAMQYVTGNRAEIAFLLLGGMSRNAEVSTYESEGRTFESFRARQFFKSLSGHVPGGLFAVCARFRTLHLSPPPFACLWLQTVREDAA
jgi:hypothetical protein